MDAQKKTIEVLKAIDEICDLLQKAARPSTSDYWSKVTPSQNVPDVPPEQVIAARGSEMPISSAEMAPAAPEANPSMALSPSETPALPEGVRENLVSQYTPERLHQIVQHASKSIANALMESIIAHQNSTGPISVPKQNEKVPQ